MARVRRKPAPVRRVSVYRLNLEILGIAAFGLAILIGVALLAPHRTGALGTALVAGLTRAFGGAAWLLPIAVAMLGGIVFLEINVPRLIAKFGAAALAFFVVADTAYGARGGVCGRAASSSLESLVGPGVAPVVLALVALSLALWITGASLKRTIGWTIAAAARLRAHLVDRAALRATRRLEQAQAATPAVSAPPALAGAPPQSLREAFNLGPLATPTVPMPPKPLEPARPPKTKTKPEPPSLSAIDSAEMQPQPTIDVAPPTGADVAAETEALAEDDAVAESGADALLDGGVFAADGPVYDVARERELRATSTPERAVVGDYEPATLAARAASPAISLPDESGDRPRTYVLPPLSLFDPPQVQIVDESSRATLLEDTLASFGVNAKVVHIERGPSITRYELKPERGIKISRISALTDDLALALAATSVRIEAPIPGKSAVGIEVPNANVAVVAIREIFDALPLRGTVPPLHMALGKDITGRPVFGDLGKMPHLLVAGATGSGKSVCLNGIIASLLVSATPDQVQMLFIDPKRVELTVYNGIPHLIKEVITDPRLAAGALFEMTKEMDTRYERFAKAGVRKIEEYNAKYPDEHLPYVVIVIDELADLMLIAPAKVETTICRLAQLARATGIHLVVATQRPSVDVITGIIKANIPSRIAFAVSSQVDSRTILDMVGAERLLGRGDMLYLPIDAPKPVRAQGALITGSEISRLVAFWAAQASPENLLDVDVVPIDEDEKKRDVDPLCYEAAIFIIDSKYASTAQLQQRFSIGHPRAVKVMKQLEEFGVVGPHEGTKPRQINIGRGELETIADRLGRDEQLSLEV